MGKPIQMGMVPSRSAQKSAGDKLAEALTGMKEKATENMAKAFESLGKIKEKAWEEGAKFMDSMAQSIPYIGSAVAGFGEFTGLAETFGMIFEPIKQIFQLISAGADQAIAQDLANTMSSLLSPERIAQFQQLGANLAPALINIMDSLVQLDWGAVATAINAFIQAINFIVGAFTNETSPSGETYTPLDRFGYRAGAIGYDIGAFFANIGIGLGGVFTGQGWTGDFFRFDDPWQNEPWT